MRDKYGVIIKQYVYKVSVHFDAKVRDQIEEARSIDIFNMIIYCVGGGPTLNKVEKI